MIPCKIPASFIRGGTSKAVTFNGRDLPTARDVCDGLFLVATSNPDPNGRQLDGMGGGISSLSKWRVIAPTPTGERITPSAADLTARIMSSRQPHRALPLTASPCMALAAGIEGAVVSRISRGVA